MPQETHTGDEQSPQPPTTGRRRRGPEFYAKIGRKGGESTKSKYGSEHFATIGRKGGSKPKSRQLSSQELTDFLMTGELPPTPNKPSRRRKQNPQ